MRSVFFSLDMARRALAAQRRALDVVGHNVANANTKGYSRQEISFAASNPYTTGEGAGQVGTGVTEEAIVRYRNDFLDRQFRAKAARAGYYENRHKVLDQVEKVLGEPSDHGLRALMDELWDAFGRLNNRPGELDARVQLRERALSLLETAKGIYQQFSDLKDNLDFTLSTKITEVNTLAAEVTALNGQINQALTAGQHPNDLRDKRDLVLDQLSALLGISTVEDSTGQTLVFTGAMSLVNGVRFNRIQSLKGPGMTVTEFRWADGGAVEFADGETRALLELRDDVIPRYMGYLDTLLRTVAERVNAVHQEGWGLDGSTGRDFFTVLSGPMGVHLDPDVATAVDRIAAAASAPGAAGDGANALRLAAIRSERLVDTALTAQPVSPGDFYRALSAALGVETQEAGRRSEAFDLQAQSAEQQRQAVSGVSLDEEMTRLIQYEKAYAAAARVLNAVDEVLDTLINRTGLVGR